MSAFDSEQFLPRSVVDRIVEVRIADPDCAFKASQRRKRRPSLAPTGRLNIIAADHTGRRATTVGDDLLKMANRRDLLARITRVLTADAADGLLATMDVLEELLILEHLIREAGGPSFLDGKLLIASFNRGGLAGTSWEFDDAWTGPDVPTCAAWNFDAAKALMRVLDDDPGSMKTISMCADAMRQLQERDVPMFLEPLPYERVAGGGARLLVEAEAIAKLVGVASALGNGSRRLWLKLPACARYEVVANSTTLPILILGGEIDGDRMGFFRQIADSLSAGANVRGTMIGRNVLYPPEGDPLAPALAVQAMVHEELPPESVAARMKQSLQYELDSITRWLG